MGIKAKSNQTSDSPDGFPSGLFLFLGTIVRMNVIQCRKLPPILPQGAQIQPCRDISRVRSRLRHDLTAWAEHEASTAVV